MQPTFTVKSWNPVTKWSWELNIDTCAICRNSLEEPSIEYDTNKEDNSSFTVAFGECNHAFHQDCIQRWLKTRSVCPMCNHGWEYSKLQQIRLNGLRN
jgi:RING-box protein 1